MLNRREILRCRGHAIRGPWGNCGRPPGHQTDDPYTWGALARGVAADGRRLSAPMGARALIYSRITENDMREGNRLPAQHRATSK